MRQTVSGHAKFREFVDLVGGENLLLDGFFPLIGEVLVNVSVTKARLDGLIYPIPVQYQRIEAGWKVIDFGVRDVEQVLQE